MHAILVLGVRVWRIAEQMHEEEKRAGCRAFSGVLTNCLVLGLGTYVSTSHERSIRSDSNSPWGENLSTAPRCGARQQLQAAAAAARTSYTCTIAIVLEYESISDRKVENRQKASQRNSTRSITVEPLGHHNVNMYAPRNGFLQDTGLKYSWCRVVNYRCSEESRNPKSFVVRLAERGSNSRRKAVPVLALLQQCVRAWRSMARCSTVQQGATRRRREVPMHCRDPAPGGWPCGSHSFWVRTAEHRVKLAEEKSPSACARPTRMCVCHGAAESRGTRRRRVRSWLPRAGCTDRMDPGGRACGCHSFWVRTAERRVELAEENSASACACPTRVRACHGAAGRRAERVRGWLQG